LHELARTLDHRQRGMALVEMADLDVQAERLDQAPPAHAEDDLLQQADLGVAPVERRRQAAVGRRVEGVVAVEEVQLRPADLYLPRAQQDRAARELQRDSKAISGGVGDGLAPGDLVVVRDHINLTGRNPLLGDNDPRLGPRFPDLTAAYSPRLRAEIAEDFAAVGVPYREGVYAWFLGPSYETPAEVQMAKRIGADLVGMSTVPETIALRHMGVEVAAISLVTNLAAGISPVPLSHDEITETATAAGARFSAVLDRLIPRLVAEP